MLETGFPYMQEWTQARLAELRTAARTAAQLRKAQARPARLAWLRSGAARLGQMLISLGNGLAALGNERQVLT